MLQTDKIANVQHWLDRAPGFHIGDANVFAGVKAFRPANAQADDLAGRIRDDGYFQIRHDFGLDMAAMASLVRALSAEDIPPVFAFLFDEFWAPFHALDALYGGLLGAYGMLPDFWVWNVDPQKGDSGWKPHRDKGHMALRPDGSPISLTTWIPLSEASPLNSCMYVVPANMDPNYGTPRENDLCFELPAIRALPGGPGDVFVWNQAVLHWGSRSSLRAQESRVSIAFEFQASNTKPFNQPVLIPGKVIPFEIRLKLIAKQVLQYRHMYKVAPAIERMAMDLAAQS